MVGDAKPITTTAGAMSELYDIHHELTFERCRVDVLHKAIDKDGENTDFDNGCCALLGDTSTRLQALCDRLETAVDILAATSGV